MNIISKGIIFTGFAIVIGSCNCNDDTNVSPIKSNNINIDDIKRRNIEKRENDANEVRKAVNAKEKTAILLKILSEYDSIVKINKYDENSKLKEDLLIDSLGILELMMDIENVYKIKIKSSEFTNIITIKDLHWFIEQLDIQKI